MSKPTPRHKWCQSKIQDAFSPGLSEDTLERFMRHKPNLETFNTFFGGAGPNKLFLFYQPKEVESDSLSTEQPPPELFLSAGGTTRLAAKAVVFVRNGSKVDPSKQSETDLLFVELAGSALHSIEGYLTSAYKPFIGGSSEWGKADEEQKGDFLTDMDHFVTNVQEALDSLVGGLDLAPPSAECVEALGSATFARTLNQNKELLGKFEALLEGWCDQIQEYLDASDEPIASKSGEEDVGPRAELEYWRNKMQRLTSIAEQLKRKDCRQVITALSTLTKNSTEGKQQKIVGLLRRWKEKDVNITEKANEAKDNVKYLFTLERFIEPLYTGSATTIIDTLPALMNSIKMIHTIARYYSTNERMTNLFSRITDQMIVNCKNSITDGQDSDTLWEKNAQELVRQLEACLKLSEAYQEQYRLIKKKLQQIPKQKQFDFNEMQIFGKFDLFCRRIIKLIDMFSTIDQFTSLSRHKQEGMEGLIENFQRIVKDFRSKRHDLLDYHKNKFDRDYVEFNVKISDLESALQHFINQSFESITAIETSLDMLDRFQSILQRESLKSDLDTKLNVIFQNYGIELEQVLMLYEKQKHDPPFPRNLPPVAGNITWSRHLLKRIEEPMKQFESNQNVLDGQGARRIIRMYNRLARTLVAFEYLWHQAWVQSIDQAKSGLQATLIIRHPEDGKLYVNFDMELLQLIREAKCLDRMGIEIPESAKIVLFQEEKLKSYYNELSWALSEYDRIVNMVIPVTAMVLRPHFNDMEFKLRPGMITLTWTSMNIDAYKAHVQQGLQRLEQLVTNINDIIEHRVEKNLKIVSRTLLVDLPADESFTVMDFVAMQKSHIGEKGGILQGKNVEIEHAVDDLVKIIVNYQFDTTTEIVAPEELNKLKKHYNHFMYQALLHCAKNSMNALKKRIASRGSGSLLLQATSSVHPFFEVDVQLAPPRVKLSPTLDDIQGCINESAQSVLACFKSVTDWGVISGLPPSSPAHEKPSFFDRITKDIEIVRVALLLTGCVQGIRNTVREYLLTFGKFDWVWQDDKEAAFKAFEEAKPSLDEYEDKLKYFGAADGSIDGIASIYNIGALTLNTKHLKGSLKHECAQWKVTFSNNLHKNARMELEDLTEYMRVMQNKLERPLENLDTLRMIMNLLHEVRERESGIAQEIEPIMDQYRMLEYYLPEGFMEKDEIDKKTVVVSTWKKLIKHAESRANELAERSGYFKKDLLKNVKVLSKDVKKFQVDWSTNGPMKAGLDPMEAVERLKSYKAQQDVLERKYKLYTEGEELFALPRTEYPALMSTIKEVKLFEQLFGLYTDVLETVESWKEFSWTEVPDAMESMVERCDNFASRCKKMPKRLRDYEAFGQLQQMIDDFQEVLPMLSEFGKESIMPRHWDEIRDLCKPAVKDEEMVQFDETAADFKLAQLLALPLVELKDDLEDITDGADKQLKIEISIAEIKAQWEERDFLFKEWKGRGVGILTATGSVMEELEDAQMQLQTFLTMRHVAPFREEAEECLRELSDATDILESWVKVGQMWCSLESVFTGGDIAKQMPVEAKKFAKVDKDWVKIMKKAEETANVLACCDNENLKTSLPVMQAELEKCQKSLDGYLEAKRARFPRFYFVSDSVLLIILSQGSDPLTVNDHYDALFDALSFVDHDKKDKTIIHSFHGTGGPGHDVIKFVEKVKAVGNLEDWLCTLVKAMQITVKDLTRSAASQIASQGTDITQLRSFVDANIAQLALLGIQMMWTTDTQGSLDVCRVKKNQMKECNQRQLAVLTEISSWCLQDLGAKVNRKKIETLVTVHVHQRDETAKMFALYRQKAISDASDFEWLKQARFYWQPNNKDTTSDDGAMVISVTDVDFTYQYEYMGSKERLVITPLTDKCYITLAQAYGMCFGGAPAGPAGTGKTETVKDLGSTLAIYVIVYNCTDQMSYKNLAKIFKGLCQGGLWGCFDEFNRIRLEVLSVVAQQVLSIQNTKKSGGMSFQFPGDPQIISLNHAVCYFITMNPGYAGRQELPENLKALFRGVCMMVPDFQIIKKVKLCSVGYSEFEMLSKKFFVLYNTCKQQLSNQRHYDWGLRNILSVLRTAGGVKRENLDKNEAFLLYRTLRDMNLSKLVAQDVPLFLSVLTDLFPGIAPPPKGEYPEVETVLKNKVEEEGFIYHPDWVAKIIQLFETTRVRWGIMLVGPSGGGKSVIFDRLMVTLMEVNKQKYVMRRLNPKSIRPQEMYGEIDPLSGEWVNGVFAMMWKTSNNRANTFISWMVADGPVDAIWIEDLNTVLDDNKMLTLANGDRIPMSDNVKIMFEVETLVNASPATVSRAGIIYVSETDLDWSPPIKSWINKQEDRIRETLAGLVDQYMGESTPTYPGPAFDFLKRQTRQVMNISRVGAATGLCNLMSGLFEDHELDETTIERLFLYACSWAIGSLIEPDDRVKWDDYLRSKDTKGMMPECGEHETIFEYFVDPADKAWKVWKPPIWEYPEGDSLDFSNLLVPTMDSTRSLFVTSELHKQKKAVCMVGGPGTAKTSTALMFFHSLDPHEMLQKVVSFSSATAPIGAQSAVEVEVEKRGGKSFGPPANKSMTFFLDDMSMPEVNKWGDQITLELVRLLIEQGGFSNLDKNLRGDFKKCVDLQYIAAMQHPGGGKNDIPNRLKRNFFIFNLVLPSIVSINDIYGQMIAGRFPAREFDGPPNEVLGMLTKSTIDLWRVCKDKLLPTPAKFHYIFNMRELSRVFQGFLSCEKEILMGGGTRGEEGTLGLKTEHIISAIWRHECERVFQDKLTNNKDKDWFDDNLTKIMIENFGDELYSGLNKQFYMVNFLRPDVYDDDEVLIEVAPKVYEPGGELPEILPKIYEFLEKYNVAFPAKPMNLVLFDDALRHLLRLNRLIELPRGSALLVGVGGSGKQSLTRLASFISRATCFQITMTKTYNQASLLEDLKGLYESAGHKRNPTVFLFTQSEIKFESFLETLNSVLMTGDVPGLFAKDEIMAITADLRPHFLKARPEKGEPSQDDLKAFFIDLVRDNLHVVLCMSPIDPRFPERARKFPGLINGPTIDWFLPWPKEALVAVSKGLMGEYPMACEDETKQNLMAHMGTVHSMVTDVCEEYLTQFRRQVYQTPKSYLSFLAAYKGMYNVKLEAIEKQESAVKSGLEKLVQGAADVEAMKIVLAKEDIKLAKATEDTNKMLASLEVNAAAATKESEQVAAIKSKCETDAARIAGEKAACEKDLAKAQPIVDAALKAASSIKPADVQEVKKLPKPADIIKLIFDVILILFKRPMGPVHAYELSFSSGKIIKPFFESSFSPYAQTLLGESDFLNQVLTFEKDLTNEETIEFMQPYLHLEEYNPKIAKGASNAAEGLCIWSRAMNDYHEAAKIVKPKLEALAIAQAQMDAANAALAEAETRLAKVQATLAELQEMFDKQMAEKKKIEDGAMALQRKSKQAGDLIDGLAGERIRWTEDAKNFHDTKMRLVGDCAVACAFVSYCGPFNQDFRSYLINDKFTMDCISKAVPVTKGLDVIPFLADIGTIGDWNMEGLPTDPLSIQNGILVTRGSRFPMLIDPQGQALAWIKNREHDKMPMYGTVLIKDTKLKDKLEFCMGNDKALVIVGVENDVDPMLDPILEKEITKKGKRKLITISDKQMDYTDGFMLYFITRLPNPLFSPELQAKTTLVDFTVTQKGLEEQLLGRVISKEQKALEEQLNEVLEAVNSATKLKLELDAALLLRLSSGGGNLLDDEELIGVLANTKATAAQVDAKLIAADETKKNINAGREQFRPVATRGAVLYFAIVEIGAVNPMYQTALAQFIEIFMSSMDVAERASLASKRVANIILTMTDLAYHYINRGLYEDDKLIFKLLVTTKILITAGDLKQSEIALFLRGGAALDINTEKRKPFTWLQNEHWLNILELSRGNKFFSNLPSEMSANEAVWRRWYEDNEPEAIAIPDYEARIAEQGAIGGFLKLTIIRMLRTDRLNICCRDFIKNTPQMGPNYIAPVTYTMESIYDGMEAGKPVIFLLSRGADPTEQIEQLARKRKLPAPFVCSLGEGQDVVALRALNAAATEGTWVLLQNCELMITFMDTFEELIAGYVEAGLDENFRLFLTALPHKEFPLGLLQMSTKVTNEPPAGLKAGILKSYTVLVDQDRLERVDLPQWRQLLFALCFLHSTVQERRKFGSLGWCVPYEYNTGDITACILFLERHMYNIPPGGSISWPTFQYMVSTVQYGGKITDSVDLRMFVTYTQQWLIPATCEEGFSYTPQSPILRIPSDFNYTIPNNASTEIEPYREYIRTFPEIDSPEIFGLHPNADLTYLLRISNGILHTLGETQPKGGGGGGGESREDIVYHKADELLERLPADYVEEDYKAKIQKLGGLDKPLNIFLFQEIQRLQAVIGKVRFILKQLQLAINGEVVMTDEFQESLDKIADARVPQLWTYTVSGDVFSWILPTLGLWFTALMSRDEQNRTWLTTTRPNTFWIAGFFNPNGFLTAMKQEVVRRHKADKWSLDDVVDRTEATTYQRPEQVRAPPSEGVYIHGLQLEGGAWNAHDVILVESQPKKLFVPMSVVWVTANAKAEQGKVIKELFGPQGPYNCPVYKYPKRTDNFFIFYITLKCTPEQNPAHWILRGVCLLCNTD